MADLLGNFGSLLVELALVTSRWIAVDMAHILTELRTLKLHSLKIDLSFVRNLATSTDDQRVVKLIIHTAREYGLTTTAEGVEDPAALALLREYGADRAQGYLIGRPAPLQH